MEDKDLSIKFTRGSGPGGQHKNKVETCVVITHVPTGLTERCQGSRSRSQNLKLAKERLENKIANEVKKAVNKAKGDRRRELMQNQKTVRTYNYERNEVVDHRTKTKHNLRKFMKGEIEL